MTSKICSFFLLICLSFNSFAGAGSGVALSNEIASVVQKKVVQRGFAANDPRYVSGLVALSSAALEIGIGVVIAGTAPAWGTVLGTALVAGAAGYALQSLANWIFNSDGTVTVGASGLPPPVAGAGNCFKDARGGGSCFNSITDLLTLREPPPPNMTNQYGTYSYAYGKLTCAPLPGWCELPVNGSLARVDGTVSPFFYTNRSAPVSIVPGAGLALVFLDVMAGSVPPQTSSVSSALSGLSELDKSKPLSPADVAEIANAVWKSAAAKPNYSGLPYVSTDPITAADVAAVRLANPSLAVSTVGDLAAQIPSVGAVSPAAGTDAAAAVSSNINPSTQPQSNLGADPSIAPPSLESTPTAQMILAPILNLLPSFKNFVVPSHVSSCPKPSFVMFSESFSFQAHCDLLESIRPTLYAVMAFVWLMIALIIILGA